MSWSECALKWNPSTSEPLSFQPPQIPRQLYTTRSEKLVSEMVDFHHRLPFNEVRFLFSFSPFSKKYWNWLYILLLHLINLFKLWQIIMQIFFSCMMYPKVKHFCIKLLIFLSQTKSVWAFSHACMNFNQQDKLFNRCGSVSLLTITSTRLFTWQFCGGTS